MSEGKKKLYVSIDILESLVCDYGTDFSLNAWKKYLDGKGFKYIEHREAVRWFIAAEKEDPINRKGWGLFVRTLPHVPKFLELQPSEHEVIAEEENRRKALDYGWEITYSDAKDV